MKAAPKRIEIKELPEGWIEITLNAAVESMKNGLYKPASEYAEHGVACLRMYNIDGGRIIWRNIKRMLLTSDEVHEYQLAPDDLLVNRVNSRELVGKTAVFPRGLEPCVYESKNIRVRLLSELVNSDFVNYQLLLFGQHHFNYNAQQVVGMASISQPQIGNFPLLVPPRIEQDRIVSKVQAMLAKLAKSRSHIGNVAKTLKRFRQAVLAAACSGRLTEDWRALNSASEPTAALLKTISGDPNRVVRHRRGTMTIDNEDLLPEIPDTWIWTTLGQVCVKIFDGTHFSPKNYSQGEFKYITAKNIKEGRLDLSEITYVSMEDHEQIYARCDVRQGDILYIKDGATTGIAAVNPLKEQFSLLSSVGVFRTNHEYVVPEYLEIFLNAPTTKNRMLENVSGVAITRLTLVKLFDAAFCLPPLSEQKEIVRRVTALLTVANSLQDRCKRAATRVEQLTQSILAKAFRGELVLTEAELARHEGREYEPASVLLERIRKERESHGSRTPECKRTRTKSKLATAKG